MLTTIKRVLLGSQEQIYAYLLLSLIAYVTVTPFLPRSGRLGWIADYLLLLVLVASAKNISRSRRHLWIGATLGLPAVVARLTHAHVTELSTAGAFVVAASTIAFLCFLIALVMKDVVGGRRHIGEKVTGAIVAYLLLGLVWTFIYALIELLRPGSFDVSGAMVAWFNSQSQESPTSIFLYYSFVTLTTLGFGDISPVSDAARTFTWLEAVVGQLFIAVTIARLVGIHASSLSSSSAADSKEPGT